MNLPSSEEDTWLDAPDDVPIPDFYLRVPAARRAAEDGGSRKPPGSVLYAEDGGSNEPPGNVLSPVRDIRREFRTAQFAIIGILQAGAAVLLFDRHGDDILQGLADGNVDVTYTLFGLLTFLTISLVTCLLVFEILYRDWESHTTHLFGWFLLSGTEYGAALSVDEPGIWLGAITLLGLLGAGLYALNLHDLRGKGQKDLVAHEKRALLSTVWLFASTALLLTLWVWDFYPNAVEVTALVLGCFNIVGTFAWLAEPLLHICKGHLPLKLVSPPSLHHRLLLRGDQDRPAVVDEVAFLLVGRLPREQLAGTNGTPRSSRRS